MPSLIFHITQDLQRNHMCTQPFVFMSNEMCSAIIRGCRDGERRGDVRRGGGERKGWNEMRGNDGGKETREEKGG